VIKKATFLICALGLVSCDVNNNETTGDTYQEKSRALRTLVNKYCSTSDQITLSIKGEIVEIPCGHRQHIKLLHELSGEVNYTEQSYLDDLEAIPINSIQLMVESPDELNKIWDITPPLGVVMNIYSISTQQVKQKCNEYADPQRSYCTHSHIPISDTKLGVTLRFDGHSTPAFSYYTGKTITPDEFPYAYYPKEKWPELYGKAEIFVKNLIK